MNLNIVNVVKRISVIIICMVLVMLSICFTFAADKKATQYRVDELAMSLDLPSNMIAVTRNSEKDNTYFATFGESYSNVHKSFEENDAYLMAKSSDSKLSLILTMTKDKNSQDIFNYKLLTSDQLDKIKNTYLESNLYLSCTQQDFDDFKFLDFIISYKSNGNTVKGAYSNTVVNGMIINFSFVSANGELSSEDYAVMESILKSVKFDKIYEKSGFSINSPMLWIIVIALLIIIVILFVIIKGKKTGGRNKLLSKVNSKFGFDNKRGIEVEEFENPDGYDNTNYDIDIKSAKVNLQENEKASDYDEYNSDVDQTKATEKYKYSIKNQEKKARISGFDSSADYFEEMFDEDEALDRMQSNDSFFSKYNNSEIEYGFSPELEDDGAFGVFKMMGSGVKLFFVHLGYFFKNISREMKKSSKKKKMKSKNTVRKREASSQKISANNHKSAQTQRTRRSLKSDRKKKDDEFNYTSRRW